MKQGFLSALAAAVLGTTALTTPVQAQQTVREVPSSQSQVQLSYAPVVKRTAPAVVNIFTSRTVRVRQRRSIFDMFGDMNRAPRERVENSLGSGVIVRSNGIIVTNAHVINGADELRVVFGDRREFEATVIAQDDEIDIAVLKIDAGGEVLPTLPLEMSGDVEIGDIVLAIGNPFGVGQTVTSGIVSALGRTNVASSASFIQTDAAVNPGNSGGALVSLNGELIGVNTAIFSRSGGSNGIGFAIPAELVARAIDSAVTTGEIVRPWIGARTDAVDSAMAQALGLDRARGTVISELLPDGPAAGGGLRKGDVILSVDGDDVNDDSGLRFKLATLRPGDRARIAFVRDGRESVVRVRVDTPQERPARDARALDGAHPLDGATVANLSPALAEELGFDPYATGVIVVDLDGRSAARLNRLQRGTLVRAVNGVPVTTTRGLERLLRDEADIARDSPDGMVWEVEVEVGGRIGRLPVRYLGEAR